MLKMISLSEKDNVKMLKENIYLPQIYLKECIISIFLILNLKIIYKHKSSLSTILKIYLPFNVQVFRKRIKKSECCKMNRKKINITNKYFIWYGASI